MFAYPGNVSNLTMVHVHHGKAFQEDCGAQHQGKSFSDIGAHYQNGVTEQVIGILSSCKAQVMLIHVIMALCPELIVVLMQSMFAVCLMIGLNF